MTQNATNYLVKNSDFKYDQNNVFKNDCLDRKVIIENLSNLVWSATQSFVISIESPWGTGKTVFVKLWKQFLEIENTPSIYFNAWENDFVSDPIIPFISTLEDYINNEIKNIDDSKIKTSLEKAKKLGSYIAKKSIPVLIKIGTQGLLDFDAEEINKILKDDQLKEISGLMSDYAEDAIDEFSKKKNSISEMKKKIKEISDELTSEKDKRSPLVIFIDELDRCRPDFAILVLERLKHIFSVEGVVFVLSVDRTQLENSVKAIYGADIDACGYLLRFIDYRFKLPIGKTDNYYVQLFYKYSIISIIEKREKENKDYNFESIRRHLIIFEKIYKLSLREIERLLTELNLFLRLSNPKNIFFPSVVLFILINKMKGEKVLGKINSKKFDIDELDILFLKLCENLKKDEIDLVHNLQGILVKYLVVDEQNNIIKKVPEYYLKIDNEDTSSWSKYMGFNLDLLKNWSIKAVINGYFSLLDLIKLIPD